MEYTNPEIPEGINTSKENPLKEFFILTVGVLASVFVLISLLILLIDYFADQIPFAWEQSLPVAEFFQQQKEETLPPYLAELSNKIINNFDLPENMQITVHYVNGETVNAFATLGGHIVIYRGLLEKLNTEDELAMVIAHEIAHIKYRHPILSTSHGVVVGVVLSLIGVSTGDDVVNKIVGSTSMMSLMKFSRDYEYQADEDAIKSLLKIYGHAEGATGLFNVFSAEAGKLEPVEFLSTHPLTENRISNVQSIAASTQPVDKPLEQSLESTVEPKKMTPLPESFKNWLQQQSEKTSEDKIH